MAKHEMRYRTGRAVAALFLLLVFSAGCGPKTPRLPALAPEAVVLAFGDSLTFGTGANPEESYPAQLSRLIGRTVINAGVPGEVSADGLTRLPLLLDAHSPALLVLCHGGNDFLRRLDESATAQNLRDMVKLARSRGIAVVLVGVPRANLGLSVPPFYAELAAAEKLPVETGIVSQIERDRDLKSDSVHPNAAGYRRFAEALARLLRAAGAIEKR